MDSATRTGSRNAAFSHSRRPARRRSAALVIFAALMLAAASAFGAGADLAEQFQTSGFLFKIVLVFAGGVLVSLTPCLYPMVPVTLSVIGARNVGQKPIDGFLRALTFVLGIALVYTALGVAATLAGKSISFVLQYKAVWLFLSFFFIAMGLSMLGLFNIQLPPSLAGKLQGSAAGKGGHIGAFLVGLVTGVAASPCGTPVLAAIATYAAEQSAKGHLAGSISLFFFYSLGMGTLFMVLGAAPTLLTKMPRSGGWMEDIKKFLGALLIGVGIYYLAQALPYSSRWLWVIYWVVVIIALLITAVIVAIGATERRRYPMLQKFWFATALSCCVGAFWTMASPLPAAFAIKSAKTVAASKPEAVPVVATTKPVDMIAEAKSVLGDDRRFASLADKRPEAQGVAAAATAAPAASTPAAAAPAETTAGGADEEDGWLTDEPSAIAAAIKWKRPVLIDFTAEWCANCKKLERTTFKDTAVADHMKRYVKIRIDVTETTPENAAITKKYAALSFPTIAFIDAKGVRRADKDLKDYETADKFLARLKAVHP